MSVAIMDSVESGRRLLKEFSRASYGMPLDQLEKIQALAAGPADYVAEHLRRYVEAGTRHLACRIATRRYRMELPEDDYRDAVRAHSNGLQVSVTGDREERGTHLQLRRLTTFSVIPGLGYEDGDLPET